MHHLAHHESLVSDDHATWAPRKLKEPNSGKNTGKKRTQAQPANPTSPVGVRKRSAKGTKPPPPLRGPHMDHGKLAGSPAWDATVTEEAQWQTDISRNGRFSAIENPHIKWRDNAPRPLGAWAPPPT